MSTVIISAEEGGEEFADQPPVLPYTFGPSQGTETETTEMDEDDDTDDGLDAVVIRNLDAEEDRRL